MESRGKELGGRAQARPGIARRSCDQCRARKIGCDRGTPCSNCVSARVDCTHSAVASQVTAPRQRILISAQYERKIDEIAKSLESIKMLLQGPNPPAHAVPRSVAHEASAASDGQAETESVERVHDHLSEHAPHGKGLWDHSLHIVDFVKAVVEETDSPSDAGSEATHVLSSLRSFVSKLESPGAGNDRLDINVARSPDCPPMPPSDAAVAVLRWAKDHQENSKIALLAQILPLDMFADICRRVYFAVDDYSEIDVILANGYLSHIFTEYVSISGQQDYSVYCQLCRKNFFETIVHLPLLLTASMETVAALTIGALNAIEDSKSMMAWTYISKAANLCQTLGYHRIPPPRAKLDPVSSAKENLFWSIYRMDRGLSLRFGRASNIRDSEITLPCKPNEPRQTRLARIQGKVYDQLYSPSGLSLSEDERGSLANKLAKDLRGIIAETNAEVVDITRQPRDSHTDPKQVMQIKCDLICQYSLLTQILRAIPTPGVAGGVSDECVAVARDVMELHEQCMAAVRSYKSDPLMVTKYINWAILHTPFVPFSILFTRAVRLSDLTDLALLDRFAASLQPETSSTDSITHPYRLYELLCRAARLYISSNMTCPLPTDPLLTMGMPASFPEFDFAQFGSEAENVVNEALEGGDGQAYGLSEWYYGNQQIMSLLEEDMMF